VEGGAKFLGYFVWKITILRQKIILFSIAEGGVKILGYFVWKITILCQKIIFFSNFRGGARRVPPPPESAHVQYIKQIYFSKLCNKTLSTEHDIFSIKLNVWTFKFFQFPILCNKCNMFFLEEHLLLGSSPSLWFLKTGSLLPK
jgi:hypothetical protein